MTALVVDTSVAVPLVVQTHTAHQKVTAWWGRRSIGLSGHAAVETYSVLTRLPRRFGSSLKLSATSAVGLPSLLSRLGIAGGAVYDALVAMAAIEHGAVLATRDLRARSTYELIGATVEFLPC